MHSGNMWPVKMAPAGSSSPNGGTMKLIPCELEALKGLDQSYKGKRSYSATRCYKGIEPTITSQARGPQDGYRCFRDFQNWKRKMVQMLRTAGCLLPGRRCKWACYANKLVVGFKALCCPHCAVLLLGRATNANYYKQKRCITSKETLGSGHTLSR